MIDLIILKGAEQVIRSIRGCEVTLDDILARKRAERAEFMGKIYKSTGIPKMYQTLSNL